MDILQKNLERHIEKLTDAINGIEKDISELEIHKQSLVKQIASLRKIIEDSAIERRNTPIER